MKNIKKLLAFLILGIGITLFSNHPAQAQNLFIRGDVNCDGSVTPADTTYLADYLFRGGPGPACRATADLNDNAIINLEDYFYLVNYFSGGPAPFLPFPFCGTDLSGPPCTLSCCPGTECSDGIDNDGDGLTDFPADCGCTDIYDTTEAPNLTECYDGIDNDGDGFTDLADCGCANACDTAEAPDPLTECNDGIDNDGDGLIDDADCGCNINCNRESPRDQCHDGIDNDGDGLVDLADTNCVDSCDFDECSQFPCSTCCYKPGDFNGDGTINITDVVGLVNHVFKGAPPPCPKCRGDFNNNNVLNLTDIVRMVGFVFKGGSDPIPSGVCCLPT